MPRLQIVSYGGYLKMYHIKTSGNTFDTMRSKQNLRHIADDIFKCIFLNENQDIFIQISLKLVTKGLVDDMLPLPQVTARCRISAKLLPEQMMTQNHYASFESLSHNVLNAQYISICFTFVKNPAEERTCMINVYTLRKDFLWHPTFKYE